MYLSGENIAPSIEVDHRYNPYPQIRIVYNLHCKGIARTQSPTIKNYAFELPTFGVIVGVSPTEVQWKGLTLEEPPS